MESSYDGDDDDDDHDDDDYDDDDDDDDNDDKHYPILTHKNPYMGKSAYGNLGAPHQDQDQGQDHVETPGSLSP